MQSGTGTAIESESRRADKTGPKFAVKVLSMGSSFSASPGCTLLLRTERFTVGRAGTELSKSGRRMREPVSDDSVRLYCDDGASSHRIFVLRETDAEKARAMAEETRTCHTRKWLFQSFHDYPGCIIIGELMRDARN
jgi:hypothetical protein